MHSISFGNLSMLRHKARVVRWSRIHQPSKRSSAKIDKICKVLRFMSKWTLSKWHYCPSDIIVQVTLLSKWQYCPSEYCPSDIIVQVNIVQVTLLSKSMYFTRNNKKTLKINKIFKNNENLSIAIKSIRRYQGTEPWQDEEEVRNVQVPQANCWAV